jgi:UPF0755 protein
VDDGTPYQSDVYRAADRSDSYRLDVQDAGFEDHATSGAGLDALTFGGRHLDGPGSDTGPGSRAAARQARSQRRRRRRRRRLAPLLALIVILILVAVSYVVIGRVRDRFNTPDYAGSGHGSVDIRINSGDAPSDIAATLLSQGVVKSTRAFIDAASASGEANDIQPGVYKVALQSSGAAAMAAILNPADRLEDKVVIPEGSTYRQVLQIIASQTQLSMSALSGALADAANLGIPAGYPTKSGEGFLFPATYDLEPGSGTTAESTLQLMVQKFAAENTALNIAAAAKALKLTPYAVLTIASIAQAEAKFDSDTGKVARVIMNRLAAGDALQVDATSAYAAKIAGKDPTSVNYATYNTPFNSYTHKGLPPTPIGNPGAAAIGGATNPPAGTWLYYVNIDAAGHLGFFTDPAAFATAVALCHAKGWGCA